MKRLIYLLYIVFFVLMAATFYTAFRVNDGLVEEHYYEKSKDYFNAREAEEAIGFRARLASRLARGKNMVNVELSCRKGPITGARVRLFAGSISTPEHDRAIELVESAPGRYSGMLELPLSGRWLLRADIESREVRTDRRWDVVVE